MCSLPCVFSSVYRVVCVNICILYILIHSLCSLIYQSYLCVYTTGALHQYTSVGISIATLNTSIYTPKINCYACMHASDADTDMSQ